MNKKQDLITFVQKAIQTRSYSDEEGEFANLMKNEMEKLGYDEAFIDSSLTFTVSICPSK